MPLFIFIRMWSFWRAVNLGMVEATLKLLDEHDTERVRISRARRPSPRWLDQPSRWSWWV